MKRRPALALLLSPCLLGVGLLFGVPFCIALWRSLAAGPGSYLQALTNPMFRLGTRNLLRFLLLAIPGTTALALWLALLLRRLGRGFWPLLAAMLLPALLPSGSTAFFWNCILGVNGVINRLLYQWGQEIVLWDSGRWSILLPAVLYLWKFCGLLTLVFWVGLGNIPREYYELARLEGAGPWTLLWRITLTYLTPSLMLALLLGLMSAFRISRELLMLFGRYPDDGLYLLQHFLAGQLEQMNLPVLGAAAVLVAGALLMAAVPLWRAGQRTYDSFTQRGEWNLPAPGQGRGQKRALVIATVAAVLFLLPVLFTAANSLLPAGEAAARYSPVVMPENAGGLARGGLHFVEPVLLPGRLSVTQYRDFLSSPAYLRMFWNSVALTVPAVLLHLLVSAAGAYGFFRLRGRRMELVFGACLLLMAIPAQVMVTPQYLFFRELGLEKSWWAVVLPAVFHPAGVCLLRLQLAGFPPECIDAARENGAGELQVFTRIVLPGLREGLMLLAVYTFAECWNGVEQAVVFLHGYRLPLSVPLARLLREDIGILSAASVVYLAPVLLIFLGCLLELRQSAGE